MDQHNKYKVAIATTSNKIQQMITVFDAVIKILRQIKQNRRAKNIGLEPQQFDKIISVFCAMQLSIHQLLSYKLLQHLDDFYTLAIRSMRNLSIDPSINLAEIDLLTDSIQEIRNTIDQAAKTEGLI